jgi:hypothetical protein
LWLLQPPIRITDTEELPIIPMVELLMFKTVHGVFPEPTDTRGQLTPNLRPDTEATEDTADMVADTDMVVATDMADTVDTDMAVMVVDTVATVARGPLSLSPDTDMAVTDMVDTDTVVTAMVDTDMAVMVVATDTVATVERGPLKLKPDTADTDMVDTDTVVTDTVVTVMVDTVTGTVMDTDTTVKNTNSYSLHTVQSVVIMHSGQNTSKID